MIIINGDNVIETEKDLNLFLGFIDEEVYDEDSEKVAKTISEYLIDVFDRMKRVNISLNEKISEDLLILSRRLILWKLKFRFFQKIKTIK